MKKAEIDRRLTVIWTVIPWWNYTRKVTRDELRERIACVKELIGLLPEVASGCPRGKEGSQGRALSQIRRVGAGANRFRSSIATRKSEISGEVEGDSSGVGQGPHIS